MRRLTRAYPTLQVATSRAPPAKRREQPSRARPPVARCCTGGAAVAPSNACSQTRRARCRPPRSIEFCCLSRAAMLVVAAAGVACPLGLRS